MPPKKAVSAYFLFCHEHREAAKAQYLAQAETEKVNVAAIAKLLGEQWRQLSDEERKAFQSRAADMSAAAAAEQASKEAEDKQEHNSQVFCPGRNIEVSF